MTRKEQQELSEIERLLRAKRLSFDARLELADRLVKLAWPIKVIKPRKP